MGGAMKRKTLRFGELPPAPHSFHHYLHLGQEYARRAAPEIQAQARSQGIPLPFRVHEQLYGALKTVTDLLEEEHDDPWGKLTGPKQMDFLVGWWHELTKLGIYLPASQG